MQEKLFDKLANAILRCKESELKEVCKKIIEENIDPIKAVEKGVREGLDEVGKRFEMGELFIPELIAAGRAAEKAIKMLTSKVKSSQEKSLGRVVIGTVQGDVHDLGKNIVALMLRTAGFEVFDLGVDVSPDTFVKKIKEVKPDILGLSALMMTTLPAQREVIEPLSKANLRGGVKVMIGGVATTQEWADEIGADAYGDNAVVAVQKAKELLRRKRR